MEPYLLFSLIYFKMVRLFRVDSLSVRFVGNSLSLEILLAIDNFQYTVTNTYTLSEFEINQIKWDRIMWSGKFELGGSRDNKKWDLACFDHVIDLDGESEELFTRLCFRLNTQRPKIYPIIVLKKYIRYLRNWHSLKNFTIHWSELPLLKSVVQKHYQK